MLGIGKRWLAFGEASVNALVQQPFSRILRGPGGSPAPVRVSRETLTGARSGRASLAALLPAPPLAASRAACAEVPPALRHSHGLALAISSEQKALVTRAPGLLWSPDPCGVGPGRPVASEKFRFSSSPSRPRPRGPGRQRSRIHLRFVRARLKPLFLFSHPPDPRLPPCAETHHAAWRK